jgi:hypothetical protein
MPVGMSLLSVFLTAFFAFVAIQCTGVTDITPLTAVGKISQLVLGGATKGEHWDMCVHPRVASLCIKPQKLMLRHDCTHPLVIQHPLTSCPDL